MPINKALPETKIHRSSLRKLKKTLTCLLAIISPKKSDNLKDHVHPV